jgi:hypothetical protein
VGRGLAGHLAVRGGFQGLGLMAGAPLGGILFALTGGSSDTLFIMSGVIGLVVLLQLVLLPAAAAVPISGERLLAASGAPPAARGARRGGVRLLRGEGGREDPALGAASLSVPFLLSSDRILVSGIAVARRPWPAVLLVATVASFGTVAFLGPTLAPHVKPYGVGALDVGLLLGLASACFALVALAAGTAMESTGHAVLIVAGLMLETVGLVFLGPAFPQVPLTLGGQVASLVLIGGGAGGLAVAIVPGILADENVQHLGTGSADTVAALAAAFSALGEAAGPFVGGLLAGGIGFAGACFFLAMALVVLLGAIFVVLLSVGTCHQPFCPCRPPPSASASPPLRAVAAPTPGGPSLAVNNSDPHQSANAALHHLFPSSTIPASTSAAAASASASAAAASGHSSPGRFPATAARVGGAGAAAAAAGTVGASPGRGGAGTVFHPTQPGSSPSAPTRGGAAILPSARSRRSVDSTDTSGDEEDVADAGAIAVL